MMKTYQLLMAGALLACAAGANADINKCVDAAGRVTFTDAPCAGPNATPLGASGLQSGAVQESPAREGATQESAAREGAAREGAAREGVTLATGEPQLSSSGERIHGNDLSIAVRDVRSPWASLPRPVPKRAVSLDAATLQAARSTMVMQDGLRRQVAMASR
ncbi:DUF4124 domain-containing protein [Oxalobacteraceae bacterium A2-2]